MTDTRPERSRLVAVTNVAFDGPTHPPGADFDAPHAIAEELIAAGAARPFEDSDEGGDLEAVKGIGPKTAGILRTFEVNSLTLLAELEDAALKALADRSDFGLEELDDWRRQARSLVQRA